MKITLFLLIFLVGGASAQTATVENVLGIRSTKSSGEIIKDKRLVGYYVFFFKEKVDKKNSAYEVQTFDDNYNPVKAFEFTRPKNTAFVEMAFNGSVFLFHFYDRKTGYEFVTYDTNGEKQGSHKVSRADLSSYDLAGVSQSMSSSGKQNLFYSVGSEGFVRRTFSKNKKMGYELVRFDNNADIVWSVGSPKESKLLETIAISDINEKITVGTITRKKSLMTKSIDVYGVLINTENGEIIKEIEMGSDEEGHLTMMKSFISLKNDNISIVGEFYNPKDNIVKDRSQGLYIQEFDMEGNELDMHKYNWKGDFDKFKNDNFDEEDQKADKRPYYIYFHNIIQSKDGDVVFVGEQFIKQISGKAIAGKLAAAALGGTSNASSFEIRVANMVVIKLNSARKLVEYQIIQKKKRSVLLPEGSGLIRPMMLGHMVKSYGGFDYFFTSSDFDADRHDIVFTDANRKEEKGAKKSDLMLGVITVKGGDIKNERTAINTESSVYWFQPAKPGYISIGEYYRKSKTIEFRLEPTSY